MNRAGILDKHDLSTDRIREDIFAEVQAPGGLFFTGRRLLGFSRLNEKVHRPAARFIEEVISKPFGDGSLGDPRGQGKSTLAQTIPFWLPLQPAVPGTPLRGLDSRLAYVAPRIDLARYHHLAKIRDLFDQCEVYRELTGDIIRPRRDMWGLKEGMMWEGADVKGGRNIIPLGMETTSTTLHPIILVIDDAITEQNYRSHFEILKILDWIDKSFALIEPEQGVRLVIGNIWAKGDVQDTVGPSAPDEYKHLRNFRLWRRGIVACPECINGWTRAEEHPSHADEAIDTPERTAIMLDVKPAIDATPEAEEQVFPATLEDAHRTVNSVTRIMAMAQYFNRPVALGTVQFDEKQIHEWEPYYDARGDFTLAVGTGPDNWGKTGFKHIPGFGWCELLPKEMLSVYILVDPASSEEESKRHCRFAVATIGLEKGGPRIFLLEEYAKNRTPQQNYDAILDSYLQWRMQFRKMGVESVGHQATIPRAIFDRARVRGITTLALGQIEKIPRINAEGAQMDRIRYTMSGLVESGMIYARRSHTIFRGELGEFGIAGARHDFLDAFSNGPLLWGPARTGDPTLARTIARRQRSRRDAADVTGY